MTETKTNFQILNELITNHIMTILNEEMSGWNRIHLYPPPIEEYIQTSPNCLILNLITPNHYAFRSTIAA